ncbi:hypothetical protein [Arthrobacter celericrescens]|uniref:hypothetical protein n=1 Tax=Arthrobacter celericrescens TaxID=2320851 RepID=UPI000EA0A573|nr:hypothetical protein [Arthrobacter celericrescens]
MNRVQRGKLAMAAVAIGAGLLSVTGCGYINAQQTSHQYAASDGVKADLGSLELRNIAIVSTGADKPGRVIGAVFNQSSSDATLVINGANGAQTSVPVKAKSQTYLNEESDAAILSSAGGNPGSLVTVSLSAGSESSKLQVPVLDGSLVEYQKYLPAGATPTATPGSTASEGATHKGESGHATEPATTPSESGH